MKPYRSIFAIISLSACMCISAQTVKDEFDAYRNQIMGEYNEFKESILKDYDTFLDAIWADFKTFNAKSKYSEPKPKVAPVADLKKPNPAALIPKPKPNPESESHHTANKPSVQTSPKKPNVATTTPAPSVPKVPKTPTLPQVPTVPVVPADNQANTERPSKPALPIPSTPSARPALPTPLTDSDLPAAKSNPDYKFQYRGMELAVEDVPVKIKTVALQRTDFAEQWRNIQNGNGPKLIEAFRNLSKKHNLNDYLIYDVLMHYVNARYPETAPSSKMSLVQYVLANMGIDARIALDEGNQPLILIPFDQTVYARRFITISDYPYYVFGPEGGDSEPQINGLISTATLPADRDLGRHINLLVNNLQLPEKMQDFNISYGRLNLTGSFNANVIPVLYHYPQMPTEDFASSIVLPEFREGIVDQVRTQLAGMPQRDAVNALLRFTQSAFKYATDEEFHGFEKPYFFEEMFYYPKCDCEDRSVFYTYLLWHALNVENHLLSYPIHESASVCLDDQLQEGDRYEHNGKLFYISDPTYIGSRTGMCMPSLKKIAPGIDKQYTKENHD